MSKKGESKPDSANPDKQSKNNKRWQISNWIDSGFKIVIALIGLWLSYLGYSYQIVSTSSQLLVQQSKGDTEIRAQMFSKITDRLMKPNEGSDSLLEDLLLAQVLALNFHELIELKPLMMSLDGKINYKLKTPNNPKEKVSSQEYEKARDNLRSVARRVRDRQVAALIKSDYITSETPRTKDVKAGDVGFVEYISFVENGNKIEKNDCFVKNHAVKNACMNEMVSLPGFRKKESVYISMKSADWESEIFNVSLNTGTAIADDKIVLPEGSTDAITANNCSKDNESTQISKPPQGGHGYFNVGWYDFPYTDNTLRPNGDRYAIFVDRVCKQDGPDSKDHSVRLGVLYFPRDYYPSRERAVSYKQFQNKLDL